MSTIIIPILQIKEQRQGKLRSVAHGHSGNK